MIKKVLGGLFFAGALFMLIGAIANGTLFSDQGSAAATYGYFLGTILPVVVYVWSGFFLLTFDKATKLNYIDGFKKRSKQTAQFSVFVIIYSACVLLAGVGAGTSVSDNFIVAGLVAIVPYAIPMFVFIYLHQMYALTHQASKKYFVNSDSALNEYLSANETFYAWSEDHFVFASNKVLFFPQLFCVIPFHQISSLQAYKQLGEQGVYIHLVNGKKIYIATKHFERIQAAVNANQAR